MGTTFTDTPWKTRAARTVDAAATDVAGLIWTPADKTAEVYEIEAVAVRENTANPLSYSMVIRSVVGFSGGAAAIVGNTSISEIGDGTGSMGIALVLGAGGTVKVQVTGVAGTTLNWIVRARRVTLLSN